MRLNEGKILRVGQRVCIDKVIERVPVLQVAGLGLSVLNHVGVLNVIVVAQKVVVQPFAQIVKPPRLAVQEQHDKLSLGRFAAGLARQLSRDLAFQQRPAQ